MNKTDFVMLVFMLIIIIGTGLIVNIRVLIAIIGIVLIALIWKNNIAQKTT